MPEAVRLVVWDLDDTFWAGTLTEGGIEYRRAHHDIVVALARRGIMSSICSKNDLTQARDILVREGIWDYFIFPSIAWQPKGPRLQALVAAVQLRAPSILFIDDNHGNLSEATYYVPELQVSDQSIIAGLLDDPRLQGKDDSALSRLRHYKLLEQRKQDEAAFGGGNLDFLRASDIRVRIDYDVEAQLDRAIELINRTNQLNYTKQRLPEDPVLARLELRRLLALHDVQAGLIRVSDRYGDYGVCGFYVTQTSAAGCYLLHFCFSCRILNMGVETWVYQKLGRPHLWVEGEVLTPIDRDAAAVDWISLAGGAAAGAGAAGMPVIGRLFARGGCDLAAVVHYLAPYARETVGEFNTVRDGVDLRLDHSQFLRYALDGMSEAEAAALELLGYQRGEVATRLPEMAGADAVWLFSFWSDSAFHVYRHRESGLLLPFTLPYATPWSGRGDKTALPADAVPQAFAAHWTTAALAELRAGFDYVGQIAEAAFKANLAAALSRAPAGTIGFVVSANERMRTQDGHAFTLQGVAALNEWIRAVVAGFPAFETIDIRSVVDDDAEIDRDDPNHFDRRVYFRLSQYILRRIASLTSLPDRQRLHRELTTT